MAKDVRTARIILLALMAVFMLVSGCAGKKDALKAEKKDYSAELDRWTSHQKIYDGLESRLYITATYKSPSFRKAYVERYAKSYQMSEELQKNLIERELEQDEEFNEIFFAAFTPNDKWNDFSQPDSIWKLFLEDSSGARLIPLSIAKVDSTDPLIREFFPYFDQWSSGYIVKFPKYTETGTEPIPSESTGFLRLLVTGILGKGQLEWRLKQ